MKRLLLLTIASAALNAAPVVAATVYSSDYARVGRVASSGSKYDIFYPDYSKAGWVSSSGGKWNIYSASYSKLGWVTNSGSRRNIYNASYSKVGWVDGGPGGPAAGAALLLLLG